MPTNRKAAINRKLSLSRRYPAIVKGRVTQRHIDDGIACDPLNCPIKLSLAEAINVPHGYIRVEGTTIKTTRRPDKREAADMPRPMQRFMINLDDPKTRHLALPFNYTLKFHTTTPVVKKTRAEMDAINRQRAGKPRKSYPRRSRIIGLAA